MSRKHWNKVFGVLLAVGVTLFFASMVVELSAARVGTLQPDATHDAPVKEHGTVRYIPHAQASLASGLRITYVVMLGATLVYFLATGQIRGRNQS
jgi:hypothetical protein